MISQLYSLPIEGKRSYLENILVHNCKIYNIDSFVSNEYNGKNYIIYDFYDECKPTIIITAHYDGFGSYDNAGGVATLFWLIQWAKFDKQLSNRDYGLILVFLDAEEIDLLGAKHFVTKITANKIRTHIHISLDGFGIGSKIAGFVNIKEVCLLVGGFRKSLKMQADTNVFQENGISSYHLFSLPEKELSLLLENNIFPSTWKIIHTINDTPDKIEDIFLPLVAQNLYHNIWDLKTNVQGIIALT